jgi:hypothetical protein
MPKWTEYTSKDTLADNDEVMLYDATARANKRGLMSKFWDYVVDKMSTAVISKLETNNKTIIGAINALNSDRLKVIKATNKSDNNPETIDITNYSTYVFFLQHDGGTNYLLAVSMAQSAQKVAKIISSGDAFDITINNKNQVTFTSSEKYWTCVVVKLS